MTYYFSPLNVNNLGIVDHAHEWPDGVRHCLHAHIYHEGEGKKGADNVASLLMKTLKENNIARLEERGFKLVAVFDNCTGQNKNNTVLKLVPFLVEYGYFEEVEFIFLVVGHTKNACDRKFNQLKALPRETNTYTMKELIEKCSKCEDSKIYATTSDDFFKWGAFLNEFYKDFKGNILQNHSFKCNTSMIQQNKVYVEFRESLLDDDKPVKIDVLPRKWPGMDDYQDKEVAFDMRPHCMKAYPIQPVSSKGINPYKQVEMWHKYSKNVSEEAREDAIYQCPPDEVLNKVMKEKKWKKDFRVDLVQMKYELEEEEGDLKAKRAKRKNKDMALDIIEEVAGMKKRRL